MMHEPYVCKSVIQVSVITRANANADTLGDTGRGACSYYYLPRLMSGNDRRLSDDLRADRTPSDSADRRGFRETRGLLSAIPSLREASARRGTGRSRGHTARMI